LKGALRRARRETRDHLRTADAVNRLHRGVATGGAAAEARSYDAALALEALRRLDAPPRRAGQSRAAASRAETRARGKLALAAAVPAIYSPDSTMRKKAALKILRDFKKSLGGPGRYP